MPYLFNYHIFISHEHTDHILGVVWMIRMVATAIRKGSYEGNLNIYCHKDLVDTIVTIAKLTLVKKFFSTIGERIFLIPLEDKETVTILDYDVTFFDIQSEKAKQYGFTMQLLNGKKFTFIGDQDMYKTWHKRELAQKNDSVTVNFVSKK